MKHFIAFCFLILCIQPAFTQTKNSYFGVEAAYSVDIWKQDDPDGYLRRAPLNSFMWGVNFRRNLGKHFFAEVGLYSRQQHIGIAFSNNTQDITRARKTIILPLKAGFRIPIKKDVISIYPVAGFALFLTGRELEDRTEGELENDNVNIQYQYWRDYRGESHAMVIAGAGIDFNIGKNAVITFSGNLYAGLSKILIQTIQYKVDNGPVSYASSTNRGSFYNAGIGFRYNLGPY